MGKLIKGGLIVFGAVIFSTLGIFASDTLRGITPGLNLAGVGNSGGCAPGTTPLSFEGRTLCVDVYEASPSEGCPYQTPKSTLETERNLSAEDCYSASIADAVPWTHVSLPQAERMCSRGGKRLPTADEWYRIALGTNASSCAINESGTVTTGSKECVSDIKAYDAVGNVWEWVDETVVDGVFDDRPLPEEGYVTSVDSEGVAITSGGVGDELYGKDYLWTERVGVLGMIRGGFYSSGEDAGLYTINASIPTSFATQGIGFRCVQDLI